MPHRSLSRRDFLRASAGCAAHLALMATPFPAAARSRWTQRTSGQVVAQAPFGRLERVGEGLWAFISTPLGGDGTTVSNGGIIAGRAGVLVVEAFQTPEGAAWMARQARDLTGRWPSHVLVTHDHSDHTRGVEGYFGGGGGGAGSPGQRVTGPALHATDATRAGVAESLPADAPETLRRRWADVVLIPGAQPSVLEVGGRAILLTPRRGHTISDVTVELPEEGITWCGDLVWNGMFPNYIDAEPSRLSRAVRALQVEDQTTYVPGHGPVAGAEDLRRYIAVIDGIEATARRARVEGWTAQEAAIHHSIPEELGEWTLFNPAYFQRAVEAWMLEWEKEG